MTGAEQRDDLWTLAAVGVLAAMAATLSHELIGHGAGCLAVSGEVQLVTTVFFRCEGGGVIGDLGGPLGNLAWGLIALGMMASRRVVHPEARLFLLLTAGLSLFWFFGQLALASVTGGDDWIYAAHQAGWPPEWRIGAVVVGVAGYDLTRRAMTRSMRTLAPVAGWSAMARRFLFPWACGLAAILGAAALYTQALSRGMMDALLGFGAAPLGLLLAVFMAKRLGSTGDEANRAPLPRRLTWVTPAVIAYVLFCLTMGVGIGPGVS